MSPSASLTFSSLCLLSLFLLIFASARFERNLFFQTCHLAARELNESNCWVCAMMPSHEGSGFPLQAVPANISELLSPGIGEDNANLEGTVLEVYYQASFPVCFQWPARPGVIELGTTRLCNSTITRSLENPPSLSDTGKLPLHLSASRHPSTDSSSNASKYPLLTAACRVWRKPFEACLSIQPWQAQEDFFWICGHRAYKQLPIAWSGSCALGHVVPAIRVTKERPAGRIRNTRDLDQSTDIVNTYQPLTNWDLYSTAWFPMAGVLRVGWAVYRLQAIIELLSNGTSETFELLAMEQRELRKLALQNRMALDIILASHGGACALIGSECCVFVPDNSEGIFDHAQHIASLGVLAKDDSHDWLRTLKEWFGSWWGNVASYLIICVLGIFMTVLLFKICYCLVTRSCQPKPPARVLPNLGDTVLDVTLEQEIDALIALHEIDMD